MLKPWNFTNLQQYHCLSQTNSADLSKNDRIRDQRTARLARNKRRETTIMKLKSDTRNFKSAN